MELFGQIMLLVLGFAMLIKGADWFVVGAGGIAKRLRIPEIVIGLTIVAFGTSAPEAAVSITAAIKGSTDLAVGNILGSNIVNVLLILGLSALIRPIAVQRNTMRFEIPFTIFVTGIVIMMGCFDHTLQRYDGAVLLVLFALFVVYLVLSTRASRKKTLDPAVELARQTELGERVGVCTDAFADTAVDGASCGTDTAERAEPDAAAKTEPDAADASGWKRFRAAWERLKEKLWFMILLTLVGLGLIVGGSTLSVDAATYLAKAAGVSEAVIALTIVALGTSLPELVTSVIAALRGNSDIAIGNIVGSNIFNILFILGITSLILPVPFAASFTVDGLIALAAVAFLFVCVLFPKRRLGRIGGGIMVAGMIGYYLYLFL